MTNMRPRDGFRILEAPARPLSAGAPGKTDAKISRRRTGFGLVEILVGSAIVTLLLTALVEVSRYAMTLQNRANMRLQALALAEEGLEAARLLRDATWSGSIAPLAFGQDYYLSFAGGTWRASASPAPLVNGAFDRRIQFAEVRRDGGTGDIVASGGSADNGARRVSATVTWSERGASQTVTLDTYLADIFKN